MKVHFQRLSSQLRTLQEVTASRNSWKNGRALKKAKLGALDPPSLSIYSDHDLVWAKDRGFPWYPAEVIYLYTITRSHLQIHTFTHNMKVIDPIAARGPSSDLTSSIPIDVLRVQPRLAAISLTSPVGTAMPTTDLHLASDGLFDPSFYLVSYFDKHRTWAWVWYT